jgi:hypothetical protein
VKPARMDDEELALRFILFRRILSEHRQIPDYNGYMDISLDKLTEDLHKSTQEDLLQYIHKFSTAMKNASYVFGNKNAFRKIKLDDTRKQLINKALFVSWSVLLADYDTKTIMNSNKQQCLLMPLSQKLNEDSTLRNYLSHGTNGKANLQYAFSCANELIQKHLKY